MPSALWWKQFYAEERYQLGDDKLRLAIERSGALRPSAALIFPHTRLTHTASQIAKVARSVIESGAETVLALGVLHGGRERDAQLVRAARQDRDPNAIAALRGIHGAGGLRDISAEEFSLDNFEHMLGLAAELFARPMPRLIKRYPFLAGTDPVTMEGIAELHDLIAHGATLVATGDMMHHGIGYDWPPEECRPMDAASRDWAEGEIRSSLEELLGRDLPTFQRSCERIRSDFRDVGPVLETLLTPTERRLHIEALSLVAQDDILGTASPTWVAAALLRVSN